MGSFHVIEQTGSGLVKLLRQELVPEFVEHQEEIDLCSPDDKGDLTVGICLYNIAESDALAGTGMQNRGVMRQVYPSLFLNLHFMITVYSESDLKYRARQEQKLLGKILQVLQANRLFPEEFLQEGSAALNYPVKIEMERLTFEEKLKIYNAPGKSYKNSLFYKVYPIELESLQIKKVHRVTDMDFTVNEEKR